MDVGDVRQEWLVDQVRRRRRRRRHRMYTLLHATDIGVGLIASMSSSNKQQCDNNNNNNNNTQTLSIPLNAAFIAGPSIGLF